MRRIILLMLLSQAFTINAQTTSSNQKPLRFLLCAAFEFGGDNLAEVYFTDGCVQKMNSGQGSILFAGGQVRLTRAEKFFPGENAG